MNIIDPKVSIKIIKNEMKEIESMIEKKRYGTKILKKTLWKIERNLGNEYRIKQ